MAKLRDNGDFWNPTFISLVQRIESAADEHLPDTIVNNLKQTTERGYQIYARAKDMKVPIGLEQTSGARRRNDLNSASSSFE
jgi:hypothetical protein